MNLNLVQYVNVKKEEETRVWFMLAMGFFIGIYVATYQVTAESLFLNKLSHLLDRAFLISGGLGIASTFLFSFFQDRIKFDRLVYFTIGLIFLTTFLLQYFYYTQTGDYKDNVLLLLYCSIGPITALLLLCYWGVFGRIFDLKQSKRIIGWIDTGQLVAVIVANFLIPLTAKFFPHTSHYLIVCDVSVLGIFACLLFVSMNFNFAANHQALSRQSRRKTKFNKIFKDKYTVLLSVFLIISVITFSFNQFIFQDLLNEQYPNQRELTNFVAYFNGVIYLLSFVIQTFLNDRIISTYGLSISLYILPILSGLLSLLSYVISLFFGYELVSHPNTFIFFFLLVALTRLFNGTLRDSLESPVFKLMFAPIDSRLRFGIQTKVEGVVNESGRLIAGIAIFLFSLLPIFKIIWIPIIVFLFCILYVVVIRKLFAEYKSKIRSKLEHLDSSELEAGHDMGYGLIMEKLQHQLTNTSFPKTIFSFRLLEKMDPIRTSQWVEELEINTNDAIREYAQQRTQEQNNLLPFNDRMIKSDEKVQFLNNNSEFSNIKINPTTQQIRKLAQSSEISDRQHAAKLLAYADLENSTSYLIELLQDIDPQVRRAAITTSATINNEEIIFTLIHNLSDSLYSNQAMHVLVLIGEKTLSCLESAFYRYGQSSSVLLRIVQIVGKIGGQQAIEILLNKIDYPDKKVVSQVLLSLRACGYKAGISQITRIKYAIENDLGDITWNLNALLEISDKPEYKRLKLALQTENQRNVDHVYMLLGMLYDNRSIQLVKENIESGTTEGKIYGVELLDVFLSEQLKVKILPVIDDLSVAEKINRLEAHYPTVRLDKNQYIQFLINRDISQTNRWTKACAIEQTGILKLAEFQVDLVAQLFNPDMLVREMAAWALYQIDSAEYQSNTNRLPNDIKKTLDKTIISGNGNNLKLFDKIVSLGSLSFFSETPGISLSYLADLAQETFLIQDEILWIDEFFTDNFHIVLSGTIQYYENNHPLMNYQKGQFIGELVLPTSTTTDYYMKANTETILLSINKDYFYELLSENVLLADRVFENI